MALGVALFVSGIVFVVMSARSRSIARSHIQAARLELAKGSYRGHTLALSTFRRLADKYPREKPFRAAEAFAAASLALELGEQTEAAHKTVRDVSGILPNHPDTVAAEGYIALLSGDIPTAWTRAKALADQQQQDPRGPYLMARVELERGHVESAVSLLGEALKRDPNHIFSLRLLAWTYAGSRRFAEARTLWQRALSINHIHVASLLDQAIFTIKQREDFKAAENTLAAIATGVLRAEAAPSQQAWAHLGLARLHIERGHGGKALNELALATSQQPKYDLYFFEELSTCFLRLGDTIRARESLDRIPSLPRPRLALLRGALFVLEKKPEKAIAELLDTPPSEPETGLWKGRALLEQGKLNEASRAFLTALATSPRFTEVHVELARIDLRLGRAAAAHAALMKLNVEQPGHSHVLEALGEALLARGDFSLARTRFAEALEKNPYQATAALEFARLLRKRGGWEQARVHLENALKMRPDFLEARKELARILFELGDAGQAQHEWQRVLAIRFDPLNALEAAQAASLAGDPELAMRLVDRAQKGDPGRARVLREYGRAKLVIGDIENALLQLRRAVHLDPSDLEAYTLYFETLLDMGKQALLRRELPKVSARFRKPNSLELVRARLELESGRTHAALEILGKVFTSLKETGASPRLLSHCLLLMGQASHYAGNINEAAEFLARARAMNPHNAKAHYFLGVVLTEMGRYSESAQALEKAVTCNPRFAEAWYRLGEARAKLGRAEAALAYREYLRLAPSGALAAEAKSRLRALEPRAP